MNRFSPLALVLATLPAVAPAQSPPLAATLQPTDPNDPVEQLGRYLRILSTSPRDLDALKGAGRAALDVGDVNAAIGFFARAEEIAPRDGTIKAGIASALVQMEQPKEALKLFEQAVSLGVAPATIAEDRGLAYDLRGDNRRAQADYALALRAGPDDETVRRLALSQAMSGDRAAALATLDPLLRKQDIAAWRASTFVLALTGDTKGAVERVGLLMVPQQASAMAPFLARLAALKPAQQALAVHFGHLPSDARADAGTALAAADTPGADRAPVPAGAPLGGARDTPAGTEPVDRAPRRRPGFAPAEEPPAAVAAAAAIPERASPPLATPPPAERLASAAAVVPPGVAAATSVAAETPPPASPSVAAAPAVAPPAAPASADPLTAQPPPATAAPAASTIGPVDPRFTDQPALAAVTPTELPPSSVAGAPPAATPTAAPAPEPPRPAPAEAVAANPAPPSPRRDRATATAEAAQAKRSAAAKPAKPATDAKAEPAKRTADAAKTTRVADTKTESARRTAADDAKAKRAVDKADAARRTADAAKSAKAKRAVETAKAETAEKAKSAAAARKAPQRYWVQVATGANKADLPKAWAKVKARYPALMAGKTPSTTPLRFTNRLLIGPFRSADEAQAFVNAAGKAGFGTSPFASAPGQAVERLGGK